MATESTAIARASHQDNKSLSIIQYMTMLFLPASFVSGIFGMGFFSTSPDARNQPKLYISHVWWWYLAAAVPLTAFVLLGFGFYKMREQYRNSAVLDQELEAQIEAKTE